MNAVSHSPPSDGCDQPPLETDVFRSALAELVAIGMELARLVRDEAKEGQAAEAAVAFDRVARAVRRTVRLARWLDQPVPMRAVSDSAGARVMVRAGIIRAVEDTIDRSVSEAEAETLHVELLERLDGPDIEDDIARRPAAEIIADICHDLGLDKRPWMRPWVRRRPADVAALHARAAAAAGATCGVVAPPVRLGRRDGPGEMDEEALALMLAGARRGSG